MRTMVEETLEGVIAERMNMALAGCLTFLITFVAAAQTVLRASSGNEKSRVGVSAVSAVLSAVRTARSKTRSLSRFARRAAPPTPVADRV